jgi:hypothetical protein
MKFTVQTNEPRVYNARELIASGRDGFICNHNLFLIFRDIIVNPRTGQTYNCIDTRFTVSCFVDIEIIAK